MTISVRASKAWVLNVCPYKFKNDKSEPKIKDSYLGHIVHTYARHPEMWEVLIDYYMSQVHTDIKVRPILRKMFKNIDKFLQDIRDKGGDIKFEVPFATRIVERDWEYVWMTGTADMVVIWKDLSVSVFDWKTTNNIDFYENKYRENKDMESDVWEMNKQWVCYPFGTMQMLKLEKSDFTFVTLNKKNWKLKTFSKDITWEWAHKELKELYGKYLDYTEMDVWPAKKSRLCHFCSLKDICPLYNVKL